VVTQGILASWLKAAGDLVEEGSDLFELETDKAIVTVPAPASGALVVAVAAGTEVTIGQVVGTIDTEGAGAAPKAGVAAGPAASPQPASVRTIPHPEAKAAAEPKPARVTPASPAPGPATAARPAPAAPPAPPSAPVDGAAHGLAVANGRLFRESVPSWPAHAASIGLNPGSRPKFTEEQR